MSCNTPVCGWRESPTGPIRFDGRGARDLQVQVPCGRCLGCRASHAEAWAVRLQHESTLHRENCFVTLTYSPQQLPSDWSLKLEHWQLFAKRLRHARGPFRFFHCGEYGETNLRPHYHAIIFGLSFSCDANLLRVTSGGHSLYSSPSLEKLWGLGFATFGSVTPSSCAYVARYVLKKAGAKARTPVERLNPDTGETWNVKPEYCTMSRNPGIGAGWFDKWHAEVYPSDEVVSEGRKLRPPRYYDGRLERLDPEQVLGVKARRQAVILERKRKGTLIGGDGLAAREAHRRDRLAMKGRTL